MTIKFEKHLFARLLNPHINTKPTLGSNFVDRKNKFEETEINIQLEAECEINNFTSSKT